MFWEYNYQMPEVSRASENGAIEKVSVSYNLPKGYEWREELPSVGAYCEGFGYYIGYQFTESPGYDIIRMNFAAQPTAELPGRDSRKAGDDVWTVHLFTYDRDLRLHPNYKTWWNYNLAISQDVTTAQAATLAQNGTISGYDFNAKTATDITIQNKDLRKLIRWVSDTNELPENWGVCIEREYTFDAYKSMTGTANHVSYYKDIETANNNVLIPGTLKVPGILVPGTSRLDRDWMIEDSAAAGDGDLATVTTIYQYYEDGWSETIYE